MDHRYGDRLYNWITEQRPAVLAAPTSWIAENWFAINTSAFFLWAAFLSYRMWCESRPGSQPGSAAPSLAPNDSSSEEIAMLPSGHVFYPGRDVVPEHHRLVPQLKAAREEIWAIWNTGALVPRTESLKIPNRKRILLPHAESIAPLLAHAENASTAVVAAKIEELTRSVWQVQREEGLDVQVRWLIKAPRNTVILGDPMQPWAWAYVELFQPGLPENMRPSLWFSKSRFPDLYVSLRDSFRQLWSEESVDPLWRPYVEVMAQQILFNLSARQPTSINGARLILTRPDGTAGEAAHLLPVNLGDGGSVVWLGYPQQFHGAGPPDSGRYVARWEVSCAQGWREAVTATYEVCVPGRHS